MTWQNLRPVYLDMMRTWSVCDWIAAEALARYFKKGEPTETERILAAGHHMGEKTLQCAD